MGNGREARAKRLPEDQPNINLAMSAHPTMVNAHLCRPFLTPRLTGAGARSAEDTNTGHEDGEAMASVGVRLTAQLGAGFLEIELPVIAEPAMLWRYMV